jgi:ketosteroid isomerase-like protein
VDDRFPEAGAAVRAAMLRLEDLVNRRDWDGLRSSHLDSPKFTRFGQGAQRQNFDEMIADEIASLSSVKDLSIDFRDLKIDVFGDVAVARSFPLFSFKGPNGEAVELEVRSTFVFVKTPNGWKITHEHNSSTNVE